MHLLRGHGHFRLAASNYYLNLITLTRSLNFITQIAIQPIRQLTAIFAKGIHFYGLPVHSLDITNDKNCFK